MAEVEESERSFDAFVSYAHADAPWVHALVDNLLRLGVNVFLDRAAKTE